MPTNVIMPALGMAQETGTLVRWLKGAGEAVAQGEPLMEVETDKVVVEIEAPASGVLAHLQAAEGDEVPVGQVIATILAPGETQAPLTPSPRPLASPRARRLAAEQGVDLGALQGTGPGGALRAEDVGARSSAVPSPTRQQRLAAGTARGLAASMARRMVASWTTAPHFFLTREVVATKLIESRERLAEAAKGQVGVRPTYTDLLVLLVAVSLRHHPVMNARWADGRVEELPELNIGVATATNDALVVPVIHRADTLSLDAIALRRADLVERASTGKLTPADVSGGTFTITNLGPYGVDRFQPVINPPQAGILAIGRIADRVVAVEGQPAVRPTVVLTLGCDHRQVDGARAARFLEELASLIEAPGDLLG